MKQIDRMQYEIQRLNDELNNAYLQLRNQRESEMRRVHLLVDELGWEKYKSIVNPQRRITK